MMLFDFSLLTKMRPVSLAPAGADARSAAARPAMTVRLRERRSAVTGVALRLQIMLVAASVRPIKAAEQAEEAGAPSRTLRLPHSGFGSQSGTYLGLPDM